MSQHDDNRYVIRKRWFDGAWLTEDVRTVEGTSFQEAGRIASRKARELDAQYGDSHFWTVDLHSETHPEFGSYYQLFHGRLS